MDYTSLPQIQEIRILLFRTMDSVAFHCNPHHELLHVLKGCFELTFADGRQFPAMEGDTLLVPAHTSHKDIFEQRRDLKILMLHFDWTEAEKFFAEVKNEKINRMGAESRSELRYFFEHVRSHLPLRQELDLAIENVRLLNILLLIYREFEQGTFPEEPLSVRKELVEVARQYIDRNYAGSVQLDDVARHLGVSRFYLSRVFSQECEFSLREYLAEVRINEAKRLLRDGNYLISEVAQRVGYESSSYFSKAFRKRVGLPPNQFH